MVQVGEIFLQLKARIYLSYKVNTMAADDQAMHGTRASIH